MARRTNLQGDLVRSVYSNAVARLVCIRNHGLRSAPDKLHAPVGRAQRRTGRRKLYRKNQSSSLLGVLAQRLQKILLHAALLFQCSHLRLIHGVYGHNKMREHAAGLLPLAR